MNNIRKELEYIEPIDVFNKYKKSYMIQNLIYITDLKTFSRLWGFGVLGFWG